MTTKTPIAFIASLLTSLFSAGQKNKTDDSLTIFPPEKFAVFEARLHDGRPVVGSINQAYKTYKKKDQYPWCLKLSIALELDSCFENGLPKENESKVANKLEDDLL